MEVLVAKGFISQVIHTIKICISHYTLNLSCTDCWSVNFYNSQLWILFLNKTFKTLYNAKHCLI